MSISDTELDILTELAEYIVACSDKAALAFDPEKEPSIKQTEFDEGVYTGLSFAYLDIIMKLNALIIQKLPDKVKLEPVQTTNE